MLNWQRTLAEFGIKLNYDLVVSTANRIGKVSVEVLPSGYLCMICDIDGFKIGTVEPQVAYVWLLQKKLGKFVEGTDDSEKFEQAAELTMKMTNEIFIFGESSWEHEAGADFDEDFLGNIPWKIYDKIILAHCKKQQKKYQALKKVLD